MQAGKLNQRIIIRRRTIEKDTFSDLIETWDDLVNGWAQVVQTPADKEDFSARAGQRQAVATYSIIMRQRKDVTPSVEDVVLWRGIEIEVTAVIDDAAGAQWAILGRSFAT